MSKWKKLKEEEAYTGWRRIIRKRFELPDGRQADFDILGASHFVTVAALTQQGTFILVRQYRPGPEMELISFPEGAIDPGEGPEEAGRRELLEETGYEAGQLIFLKAFRRSYTNQQQFCMLAVDCRKVAAPSLDETEFIEVFTVSKEEFRQMLHRTEDDSFSNVGCGYLALDYLGKL